MSATDTNLDPLGMAEKRTLIRGYLETYGLRTMVETGLYNGRGSGMEMLDLVDSYVVIDLLEPNCAAARGICPDAIVFQGDSGELLPLVLSNADEPALFWLDAHAWVGPEFGSSPPESPLLAELDAILDWEHAARSVVLIDDLRQMAGAPLAQPGWPHLDYLRAIVRRGWRVEEADDVMRCTPL